MNIRDFAQYARRTQNPKLSKGETAAHALTGLVSEVGEISSLFQHHYQGEAFSRDKLKDELGDLFWFAIELMDVYGLDPSEVLYHNVRKLKARYPKGFDEKRSANRHKSD